MAWTHLSHYGLFKQSAIFASSTGCENMFCSCTTWSCLWWWLYTTSSLWSYIYSLRGNSFLQCCVWNVLHCIHMYKLLYSLRCSAIFFSFFWNLYAMKIIPNIFHPESFALSFVSTIILSKQLNLVYLKIFRYCGLHLIESHLRNSWNLLF